MTTNRQPTPCRSCGAEERALFPGEPATDEYPAEPDVLHCFECGDDEQVPR